MLEAGCVPVPCAKGIFAVYEKGKITGMVVVYVDDGLWAGSGTAYEKMRTHVRKVLNVKTEDEGKFKLLGRMVEHSEDFPLPWIRSNTFWTSARFTVRDTE